MHQEFVAYGVTVDSACHVMSRRRPSPHEDLVMNCLHISRRNIRNFEAMQKTIEIALKSEQQQFERLHFTLQKIRSEAAHIKYLEFRLEQEKAKSREQ